VPTLHVTNGDCAADVLRSFLSDPVIIQADVLHEGPAPDVDDETWLDLRARFLSNGGPNYERIRDSLAAAERMLDQAAHYDRVVLWFEHDLFDQLQIIRTLSRLGRQADAAARTDLICIDRFPGVEPFFGLGQLDARQLSSLQTQARPVTSQQFDAARLVWTAFRASDPSDLNALWRGAESDAIDALPFLRDAIGRFLAEYPATRNGLSMTCNLAIEELEASPLEASDLFRRVQAREDRAFIGDSPFFGHLRRIATARRPLVSIAPAAVNDELRGHEIALTDAGRAALTERFDAVAQNGIDEWRGGVHLHGIDTSPWRWDSARETLVSLSE